jgi:AraC-like DNA-binding protein
MLPLFLKKNTKSFKQSFYIEKFTVPHTYDIWHNHVEIEFNHILKGSGTRFIGDSIEAFSSGDMVLVGPNLPHVWRSDKFYYQGVEEIKVDLILTQFIREFAGKDFLNLPEMHSVRELLDEASQGLQIIGKTREVVSGRLMNLADMDGGEKLMEFVQILLYISRTKEYRKLSSVGFIDSYQSKGADRINKVHDFIMNNFTEDITLKEAAEIAHMNETAFCRFFKSTTLKTFTQFLNEIRIGYACKLLLHEHLNIASVGYESGFRNISYFNRVFKSLVGITPQQYQKRHLVTV